MATIIKGTDNTIKITVRDASGNPVDIGTLSDLFATIFQKGRELQKFSLNAQPGFDDVEVVDAPNGIVHLHLDRASTRTGINGKDVFVEVKTVVVDTDFATGTNQTSTKPLLIGELVDSELKD